MPALANAKHESVALAYLADPHKIGWRAYAKAYPDATRHAAETGFTRLLKNMEFQKRIAELAAEAAHDAVMSAQEVLEELSKLGRANMADYIGPDGEPVLRFEDLSRDQSAALIEVTIEKAMGQEDVRKVKFRLANKLGALDLLAKHHSLFSEHQRGEQRGIAERLAEALKRADEYDRGGEAPRPARKKRA